jgi:hypothetical protein
MYGPNTAVPQISWNESQKKNIQSSRFDGPDDYEHESPEGQYNSCQQKEGLNMLQRIGNILKSSAFWTAVFTGLLTYFTYELVRVSDETNKTSRTTQRSFLVFNGITQGVAFQGPADPKTKKSSKTGVQIKVNWLNSGDTPAKSVIGVSNFQAWRSDLPEGFDFHDLIQVSDPAKTAMVVGPHQSIPQLLNVTIDNFAAQRAGTDRMFFWGWVAYRDAFPNDPPRLSEFCTEMIEVAIDPKKDIKDITNAMTWDTQPCHAHTCYDEDCSDYKDRIKEAKLPN